MGDTEWGIAGPSQAWADVARVFRDSDS
jgi:hypothetical protein